MSAQAAAFAVLVGVMILAGMTMFFRYLADKLGSMDEDEARAGIPPQFIEYDSPEDEMINHLQIELQQKLDRLSRLTLLYPIPEEAESVSLDLQEAAERLTRAIEAARNAQQRGERA